MTDVNLEPAFDNVLAHKYQHVRGWHEQQSIKLRVSASVKGFVANAGNYAHGPLRDCASAAHIDLDYLYEYLAPHVGKTEWPYVVICAHRATQ